MSVINPMHGADKDFTTGPKPEPKSFMQRNARALKLVAGLGVVGAVGAVGFVAGSYSAGSAPVTTPSPAPSDAPDSPPVNAEAQARATVQTALFDASNEAVTSQLSMDIVHDLVTEYKADPASWDDQFMTAEIMEAFSTLVARESDGGRELRGRELIGDYDEELVNAAWEAIEDENYSGGIVNGDDKLVVRRKTVLGVQGCWVLAEESNSAGDWFSNLDLGTEDLMSIKSYNVRDEACGCERRTLWWCSTYNRCDTSVKIGSGYDGFVKTYNAIRSAVWGRIQSTCSSSDKVIFAGYSRGGAIVGALAFAIHNDGLLPASRMSLVTFGGPRVLSDSSSDAVHNKFTTWRMINKGDLVPSIPYDWWGFKHYGTMRCRDCSYAEERDRPFASWNIGDHTQYCRFWGDSQC